MKLIDGLVWDIYLCIFIKGWSRKGVLMSTVEPIRNIDEIKRVEDILAHQSQRNLLLFTLGVNSGLRISDLLALNVGDVHKKSYIQIIEKNNEE